MRIDDLLDSRQKAAVRRRSPVRGLWLVAHAWILIGAVMAVFSILPPLWAALFWPPAVALIGARQLGLAVLMHDAAHKAIHPNLRVNEWISNVLCAWPMIARTAAYRHYHLKHHAHTQQADDPDLILTTPFPITPASLRRKIIRDLTGQTGFQQRKAQFLEALGRTGWPLRRRLHYFGRKLGGPLACNAALFVILAAAGAWEVYFLLWLAPLLTWQQLATRIRNISEHAVVPDNDDPLRNTRSTRAGWLARIFIAPYWVNYHIEHHLLMWVPCYNLPRLSRFLAGKGLVERMETARSYFEVLQKAASGSGGGPGGLVHHARRTTGSFGEGFVETP